MLPKNERIRNCTGNGMKLDFAPLAHPLRSLRLHPFFKRKGRKGLRKERKVQFHARFLYLLLRRNNVTTKQTESNVHRARNVS